VLYEATTGKHPFAAQAQLGTLVNISSPEPAAPPKTLAPEYPQSLSELVTRAIDKDPAQRFANMSELRVALERVAAELGADQQTVREYFAKTSAHRQHARTLDLQKSIDELANPSRARQVTARSRSRRWLILASGIAACGLGSWWLVARHLETPPAPVVSASARALPPAAVQPAPRPLAEPATLAQSVTLPSAAPQPPRAPAKSHGNSELQRSLDHVLKSRE
jgi:serine/threonine-protein kinase